MPRFLYDEAGVWTIFSLLFRPMIAVRKHFKSCKKTKSVKSKKKLLYLEDADWIHVGQDKSERLVLSKELLAKKVSLEKDFRVRD